MITIVSIFTSNTVIIAMVPYSHVFPLNLTNTAQDLGLATAATARNSARLMRAGGSAPIELWGRGGNLGGGRGGGQVPLNADNL